MITVSIVAFIVTALAAYLLGSIPTGFLVAKARGLDIRSVGSGNIGATNVFRHLGVPAGVLVLVADAAKGWLAVAVAARLILGWLFPAGGAETREWLRICAGFSAILGHNYTCWLHFKGGKGVATSAGVLEALAPWALLIIFGVWLVVVALSRFVSLASIAASVTLPFAAWLTTRDAALTAATALMTVLAVYKHRANIKRLLSGTESRFGRNKGRSAVAPPGSSA
jgi:glycerol-3-phosphate acyltransferase PlsY